MLLPVFAIQSCCSRWSQTAKASLLTEWGFCIGQGAFDSSGIKIYFDTSTLKFAGISNNDFGGSLNCKLVTL